jgi:addiction module HigA family antidote
VLRRVLGSIPPAPGSILRHQIIDRMGIKQAALADAVGISKVRINQIINGRAPITPEMAVRLGTVTGTVPEYWLGLQSEFYLFNARRRLENQLETLSIILPK